MSQERRSKGRNGKEVCVCEPLRFHGGDTAYYERVCLRTHRKSRKGGMKNDEDGGTAEMQAGSFSLLHFTNN